MPLPLAASVQSAASSVSDAFSKLTHSSPENEETNEQQQRHRPEERTRAHNKHDAKLHSAKLQAYLRDIESAPLSVFVFGASGALAQSKILSSLYSLHVKGLLPKHAQIYGAARSDMTDDALRQKVRQHFKLTSVLQHHDVGQVPLESRGDKSQLKPEVEGGDTTAHDNEKTRAMRKTEDDFLSRVHYIKLESYGDEKALSKAAQEMTQREQQVHDNAEANGIDEQRGANRLFYLSIPPTSFSEALDAIHKSGIQVKAAAGQQQGWNRIVIEKPFGSSLEDARALQRQIEKQFKPEQIYHADHFASKEMVQNIGALRFSNHLLHNNWDKSSIEHILINFKENFGVAGRGGYFDQFGMVRDLLQNHLLQIAAQLTMSEPKDSSLEAMQQSRRDILASFDRIKVDETVQGQYTASLDGKQEAYRDDKTTDDDSNAATYTAAVLRSSAEPWRGVPIVAIAGKGLNENRSEVRVRFKPVKSSAFPNAAPNELVLNIQPDTTIQLQLNTKSPGLTADPVVSTLELSRTDTDRINAVPEAYERLILDALRGDARHFPEWSEIESSWQACTDLLHAIDEEKQAPVKYAFASTGPEETAQMLKRLNINISQEDL